MSRGIIKPYRTYNFKTKDPIIDSVRTLIQDRGAKFKKIQDDSGVSTTTLYNWLSGPTLRPQFASIMAVVRALGADLVITEGGRASEAARLPSSRSMTRAVVRRPKHRNGAAASHH